MNYKFYGDLLISLINFLFFGKSEPTLDESIDYNEFFNFCKFHKMENIAYSALLKLNVPESNLSLFKEKYSANIFSIASQRTYLKIITSAFEENGIDYLLLKGSELSALYPKDDLRTSSDIDIYVGENSVKCKQIMLDLGFSIRAFNAENEDHDEYTLGSTLCELHPVLIQGEYPWKKECNSITDRLIEYHGHQKKMTLEDFYLYNLSHTAKHMKFSGIGIKVYLDLALITNKYKKTMDWDIVEQKLKKANLYEFNEYAKKLCNVWFNDGKTDETAEAMKEYVYSSGFSGTQKQKIAYEFSKRATKTDSIFIVKIKKSLEIFLAPYEHYAMKYPILKKHKYLTPFYRVGRIISAALFKQKTVKKVLGEFDNVDVDYSKEINAFKKSIGL